MRRVQRRFLLHSRWTARVPIDGEDGERHFEVVAVNGDRVTLRAVLTQRDQLIALTALEDPGAWSVGWISLRTS